MNTTIPEGFKQTEVGVIPEDWEVKKLGEIFDFKNGLNKEKKYFGQGTPIVNYLDVYKNSSLTAKDLTGKVMVSNNELRAYEVRKDDVFFTRTSETVDEIGVACVITEELENTVFSGFVLRARPRNNRLDTFYKKYCFASESVRKEITAKSSYTTRALTNGKLLSEVPIPVPPLPEQKAIAEVLSDIDALITALDKLITKKQYIKQGAMAVLLTGEKRLPPFDGVDGYKQTEVGVIPRDWEVKKLGTISKIKMGQSPSSSNYNSKGIGLPLLQGNADIKNRKTIIRNYTSQITKTCNFNDIIMSVRAPVGEIAKAEFKACIGRGVCAISYPNNYLYHYLVSFESKWAKFSTGSTFDSINSNVLRDLEIPLPPTKAEQTAIATILSDMDAEINALHQKRDKYKAIKAGMMEELLTGKTRLVISH